MSGPGRRSLPGATRLPVDESRADEPRGMAWLGGRTIAAGAAAAEVLAWLYGALVVAPWLCGRTGLRVLIQVTIEQLRFTGAQALPLVAISSLALGTLIIDQANRYVPVDFIPTVAATLIVREVVPLVVAMVIVGRSGTAITVQLASMKLGGEVQALVAMGILLEHIVVLPRLIGGVVSALLLSVWGVTIAVAGGWWAANLLHRVPFSLRIVYDAIEPSDVVLALVKVAIFGGAAALVAIREGLRVRQSSIEVPRAATHSAVRGVGLCIVLNTLLSLLAA